MVAEESCATGCAGLLNIRRKIEQFHDLGHTGSRHPAESG
jgi:hypothetical protein